MCLGSGKILIKNNTINNSGELEWPKSKWHGWNYG